MLSWLYNNRNLQHYFPKRTQSPGNLTKPPGRRSLAGLHHSKQPETLCVTFSSSILWNMYSCLSSIIHVLSGFTKHDIILTQVPDASVCLHVVELLLIPDCTSVRTGRGLLNENLWIHMLGTEFHHVLSVRCVESFKCQVQLQISGGLSFLQSKLHW